MIRINKLIGLLFLAGWVTGQIVRSPGVFPVTVLDVVVGGMVISAGIRGIRGIRGIWGISLTLIVSWILGLRLFSWQQSIPGGLYLLRFLGYLWVIANAGRLLSPVKKYITPAFWIFIILAWTQYLFLPDTRFLLRYGWDEHYYRMIGTVLDPNYLGVMLGIIAVYAVKEEKIWKRSNFWLAVLALGGLAATYSRASWLATGIVLSFFVIARSLPARNAFSIADAGGRCGNLKRKIDRHGLWKGLAMTFEIGSLKILMPLLFFGLVLYAVPKPGGEGVNLFRTSSVEQRIESWKEGINIWRAHPWVGVGFNNYGVWSMEYGVRNRISHAGNAPSNSWILLLATTGIIGFGWLTMVGWLAVRNINRFWVGILVMIGIHAIFNNTLFYPPVLGLLAMIKVASAD
jgi:O-antigen ligase